MKYTIQKGDTLGAIAKRHLGDANRWHEIWDSNHYTFLGSGSHSPDEIFPGTVIDLPEPRGGAPDSPSIVGKICNWLSRR